MAKCIRCGEQIAWRKDGGRWTTTEPLRDEQGSILFDARAHAIPSDTPHVCQSSRIEPERPRGKSKCVRCGERIEWRKVYARQHSTFTRSAWRMVEPGSNERHECERLLVPCTVLVTVVDGKQTTEGK